MESTKPVDLEAEYAVVRSQPHRAIDSAEFYDSAPAVGRALRDTISAGECTRKDFFVASKLCGLPSGDYISVRARVEAIIAALGVGALDLLLIHWPGANESGDAMQTDPASDTFQTAMSLKHFHENIAQAWRHMLQLKQDGLTLRVGVSNFYQSHIQAILDTGLERPYANEIFVDAVHQEREFVDFLQRRGIRVMAYRSIAFVSTYSMLASMGDTTAATIEAKVKEFSASSPQQFLLAWMIARGISPVVKTTSAEHSRQNLASIDVAKRILSSLNGDPSAVRDLLADCDGNEMAEMCGAVDEYAKAFKVISEA